MIQVARHKICVSIAQSDLIKDSVILVWQMPVIRHARRINSLTPNEINKDIDIFLRQVEFRPTQNLRILSKNIIIV